MSPPKRIRIALLALAITATIPACDATQTLVIISTPTPVATDYGAYVVKPGDTFGGIAKQFNLTIEQLIALNVDRYPSLVRDPSTLRVGWEIRVPRPSPAGNVQAAQTAVATRSEERR